MNQKMSFRVYLFIYLSGQALAEFPQLAGGYTISGAF